MHPYIKLSLCAIALAAQVFYGTVWAEDKDNVFSAIDVFALEYASEPRVAPDGNSIVYVRRSNDIMKDRTRSNIWQVSPDGTNHRPVVSGSQSYGSPRWSPGGGRLVYTSKKKDQTNLYVRWMDTGQTALIAVLEKSPSSIEWSPDGARIAFTMNVKKKPNKLVKRRKKPKGAEWAKPARVVDTVRYQFDGRGIVEPQYRQLFVVPADGGTPRQLTSGEFNHRGPLSWSPDSGSLVFSANLHEGWELETIESDIYRINVGTGELVQLTSEPGSESKPAYSPNGKLIAFIKAENRSQAYRNTHAAIMNPDGSEQRLLTGQLDASVNDLTWKRNSRGLYFLFDDRARRKIGEVSLGGSIKTLVSGLGGTSLGRPYLSGSYHVAGNDVVAYTLGLPGRPADIGVLYKGNKKVLTNLNSDLLGHKKLGDIHEVIYESSFDGQEIQAWYITPPDFDPTKKYPMILEIHGGPHLAYGPYFSAEMQLMAAAGYVVFYDNYRGSTSYGKDFALLLQYKYASKEDFADHMSGVDKMIEKGFIDENNLFIAGGSAGGIGTAYAIGLTNRFSAAVAAKPVINWISKTLTADSSVRQIRHQFPGYPWEEFEHYWKRSPLSLVANVTTPTMLLTGEADRRTPISETEQFYQALKLLGVDAVMVRLPGSPHGIASRPSRLISKVDHLLAWFDRYRTDKAASEDRGEDQDEDWDEYQEDEHQEIAQQ